MAKKKQQSLHVSITLKHPALTPMPAALHLKLVTHLGVRARRGGQQSGYVVRLPVEPYLDSPQAARAKRRGIHRELVRRLLEVRREVRDGATLLEAVADGTLLGWRARESLADALGSVRVPQWDEAPGRTVRERTNLVTLALRQLGHGVQS